MKTLLRELADTGRFTPVMPYQGFAYVCSALLVLSGLLHAGVYLVDGGPWEGPLSWRKPIVFGLSFGITLATVAWVVGLLRPRKWAGWSVLGLFAVASVGEVFLISMQKWRGVESHFNEDTPFDGMVFSMMGLLVSLIGLLTLLITVWSFVRLDASPSLALATRAGLVLTLASQVVGVQMIVEGGNTFGAAGALKLPHAVTLHAVQVLPALALALLLSRSGEHQRMRVLAVATAGYSLLIASTMVQTYTGHRPSDVVAAAAALALGGLGLLAGAAWIALRGLRSRLLEPAGSAALGTGDVMAVQPPEPGAPTPGHGQP